MSCLARSIARDREDTRKQTDEQARLEATGMDPGRAAIEAAAIAGQTPRRRATKPLSSVLLDAATEEAMKKEAELKRQMDEGGGGEKRGAGGGRPGESDDSSIMMSMLKGGGQAAKRMKTERGASAAGGGGGGGAMGSAPVGLGSIGSLLQREREQRAGGGAAAPTASVTPSVNIRTCPPAPTIRQSCVRVC